MDTEGEVRGREMKTPSCELVAMWVGYEFGRSIQRQAGMHGKRRDMNGKYNSIINKLIFHKKTELVSS